MNSTRSETIKLLFDWNKWLVTVETAAIAALGFLTKDGDNDVALILGALTILTFVAAIGLSSFFLLNLPYLLGSGQGSQEQFFNNQKVRFLWAGQKAWWWFGEKDAWRVGKFTKYITRLFLVGMVLFSLTFVAALFPDGAP
jgi:hypothetical protein